MPDVSAYQRVITTDGRQWILYAPRYMHMVDGRVLSGVEVDESDGSMSGNQIVVPGALIARSVAALWTGDQFIEAPDQPTWSDQ